MRETDLYGPIKAYLTAQGYEVKGEVGAADLVACHPRSEGQSEGQRGPHDDPIIVELKTGFTLSLFHQGVARQALSDAVYVAVPRGSGRRFAQGLKKNITLARRLGLGIITVRLADGFVEVHLDPAPYAPRQSKPRKTRLLREFARRVGDPNTGGSTRQPVITAYRQDAMRCAQHLHTHGPCRGAQVAQATSIANATTIMRDDHYGWFERVERGVYALTPKGLEQAQGTKRSGQKNSA